MARMLSSANWSLLKLQDSWAYLFCYGTGSQLHLQRMFASPLCIAELLVTLVSHRCHWLAGCSQCCTVSQVVLRRHYKSWQDLEV